MGIVTTVSLSEFANRLFEATLSAPPATYRSHMLENLCAWMNLSGALWRRSRILEAPHSVASFGLAASTPAVLLRNRGVNPVFDALHQSPGKAQSLAELVAETSLRSSSLYLRVLKPLQIECMAGLLWRDTLAGLDTEIIVVRDSSRPEFSSDELRQLEAAAPLLIGAATHASFVESSRPTGRYWSRPGALVDAGGQIYEAQSTFIDLLSTHYPHWRGSRLPFSVPLQPPAEPYPEGALNIFIEAVGDLSRVRIWPREVLDGLTQREREIATAIASGRSYKLVARELGVTPSTVSNHLQRIYTKLQVGSRSALADLVNQGQTR